MSRYRLTPKARADLDTIWSHTEECWGADQAELYVRSIKSVIESAAESPKLGRPCDEVRPGYRRRTSGSHILFYRIADDGIEIIRILHSRMDIEQHL